MAAESIGLLIMLAVFAAGWGLVLILPLMDK